MLMTNVDAKKLDMHPKIRGKGFDDIVFTNPRGPDNVRIKGTRVSWQTSTADLIHGVLRSASQDGVLKPGGVVHFSGTTPRTSPNGLPLSNFTQSGVYEDPLTGTLYDIGLEDVYDPVLGPKGGRSGVNYKPLDSREFSVEYTPRQSSGQPFKNPDAALGWTKWFRFRLR
jgi:hypothetical protein